MNRDLVEALIAEAFPEHQAMLRDLLEPSIRITSSAHPYPGDSLRSKFGGDPLLPGTVAWPTWDARAWTDRRIVFFEERLKSARSAKYASDSIAKLKDDYPSAPIPLSFIAQIDLEEAGAQALSGLPERGRLLFFYDAKNCPWGFDPATHGAAQVLYIPEPMGQARQTVGATASRPGVVFKTASLNFELEWTLPDRIENGPPELSNYKLNFKYRELVKELIGGEGGTVHRLGGYDQPIQGDMKLQAQLVSNGLYCGDPSGYKDPRVALLREGAADWMLLLQVDSDEQGPGWMWGDVGRLYYWIRKQDLAQRDFSHIWATEQCY